MSFNSSNFLAIEIRPNSIRLSHPSEPVTENEMITTNVIDTPRSELYLSNQIHVRYVDNVHEVRTHCIRRSAYAMNSYLRNS